MTAPQYALVKLPDNVTFEQAARFGYPGTSYGAMKKANAVAGPVHAGRWDQRHARIWRRVARHLRWG